METLRASRFLLRRFTSNDAPSLTDAVIESASTVGRFMPWAHPAYSTKDALDWIRYCEGEWAKGASFEFGIFDAASLQLVGGCGLNQFNSTCRYCNLGYWVGESWRRKGAGLAAIEALADYGFSTLHVVVPDNIASLALATKAGAKRECLARNRLTIVGAFVDAVVFSLVAPSN